MLVGWHKKVDSSHTGIDFCSSALKTSVLCSKQLLVSQALAHYNLILE